MENKPKGRTETTQKILKGLDLVSKRLIEDARKNKKDLIVMQGDKIVTLKVYE